MKYKVLDFLSNYRPQDFVFRFIVYICASPIPNPYPPGASPYTNLISILALWYAPNKRLPNGVRIFGSASPLRIIGRANILLGIGLLITDLISFIHYLTI